MDKTHALPRRLNTGLVYRKAFESSYSITRRFLISNSGLSWSVLRRYLTVSGPSSGSLSARIAETVCAMESPYEITRIFPNSKRITRHCPICAGHCYHTDLFEAKWLLRCPIHDEPLVDNCPECGLGWPNISALTARDCALCTATHRPDAGGEIYFPVSRDWNFALLTEIYSFLAFDQDSLLIPDYTNELQIEFVDILDYNYIAIRSVTNRLSPEAEALCKVAGPSPKLSKRVKLRKASQIPVVCPDLSAPPYRQVRYLVLKSTAQKHLDYVGHPPHVALSNYRYLSLESLMQLRDQALPCPHCMTVSWWLSHIFDSFLDTVRWHGRIYTSTLSRNLNLEGLLPVVQPLLALEDANGVYETNELFRCFWYKLMLTKLYYTMRTICDFVIFHIRIAEDSGELRSRFWHALLFSQNTIQARFSREDSAVRASLIIPSLRFGDTPKLYIPFSNNDCDTFASIAESENRPLFFGHKKCNLETLDYRKYRSHELDYVGFREKMSRLRGIHTTKNENQSNI